MGATFSQILLHVVFSTKGRRAQIKPVCQKRLYEYMGGIVRSGHGVLHTIGGMPDHVHLLVGWRTDAAVCDLVRDVKSGSSRWVHETFPGLSDFEWQKGYAVFSVSKSESQRVSSYIERPLEHHRHRDFAEELAALLRAHEIEFDARYVVA